MRKPRVFEAFPPTATCPVCGTSEDGECVLISIDGTGDGRISEAMPVHLNCAIATNWNKEIDVMYRRVKETT